MTADRRVIAARIPTKTPTWSLALDLLGRQLGASSSPAAGAGCRALIELLRELGQVERVGIEACDSYGAVLARLIRSEDVEVLKICRPNRQIRRQRGKADLLDAEAAARAVIAERDGVTPTCRRSGRGDAGAPAGAELSYQDP